VNVRARLAAGLGLAAVLGLLAGCQAPPPREVSAGHVSSAAPPPSAAIPEPVRRAPLLPPPRPSAPSETYTVVVNNVPVRELLFALARDAKVNIDVAPAVQGQVTLNAVDQSLFQILDRVSRQAGLRYEKHDGTLFIEPDLPFLRSYRIDYVNMARDTTARVAVATQIATAGSGEGGGGGNNNSTTSVASQSSNRFWERIVESVQTLLAGDVAAQGAEGAVPPEDAVIANPEAGVLLVRASAAQHRRIRQYLDQVMASARRQVMIEATIVEVELSDRYQAGIDWNKLVRNAGLAIQQSVLGANLATAPFFLLQYQDTRAAGRTPDVQLTVRLLKQFGDTRVLSSPKLMVLNNQTAVLKVVDNIVYFNVTADTTTNQTNSVTTVNTEAQTVPVGIVMAVTPQISAGDEVILNVRPTISRVSSFVNDPNPNLTVANQVPQVQVREMESMLRVGSGQLAVLGGLMQDDIRRADNGVPVLSSERDLGSLFRYQDSNYTKTELVIFLRPWVIRTPSVEADLRGFRRYLPENLAPAEPLKVQVLPEAR